MMLDCKGYGIYCVCVLDGLVDIIFDIFEVMLADSFVDGDVLWLEVVLCDVLVGDLFWLCFLCWVIFCQLCYFCFVFCIEFCDIVDVGSSSICFSLVVLDCFGLLVDVVYVLCNQCLCVYDVCIVIFGECVEDMFVISDEYDYFLIEFVRQQLYDVMLVCLDFD